MTWAYETEITADVPGHWYKLNEGAGTTATDDGSVGEDGTYTGTAAEYNYGQDPIIANGGGATSSCVLFNLDGGAADDGAVERTAITVTTGALAVECWIENPTSPAGRFLFSYAIGGGSPQAREFSLEYVSNSTLRLYVKGTGTLFTLLSAQNNLADGRAHHIAVTWDNAAGDVNLYMDGNLHATATGVHTAGTITSGGTFMIAQDQSSVGVKGAAGQAWQGRLDQVAIYATDIGETRWQAHFSAGLTRYVSYESIPDLDPIDFDMTGGSLVTYTNRVYDLVAVDFVRWDTLGSADPAGASYPGPDAFGSTLDYCVETVA
jgi:hypothetical protein